MVFENFVITGFKRRQRVIRDIEIKSQRLRNEHKIQESKLFEDHTIFLKKELGTYFQQYRQIMLQNGILPADNIGIPALTESEKNLVENFK